jgi:glycosyltransferase involved in cell wall biosynthesis/O-antigen/teichoic acid export membrane protein
VTAQAHDYDIDLSHSRDRARVELVEPRAPRQLHETTLVLATGCVSALNYAYTLLLIWLMPANEYSVVGSATALLLICGTVSSAAVPWVLAREVAMQRSAAARRRAVSFCISVTLLEAGAAGVAVTLVTLNYATNLTVAVTFGAVVTIFVAATAVGYLQGLERFRLIATLRVSEVVVKILSGVALVLLGVGAAGAIAGFMVGAALVAVVGLVVMRADLAWVRGSWGDRELWGTAQGLLGIQAGAAALASLDIVLASVLITTRTHVATYQAAQVLGRVPVFIGAALSIVVFPRLVARRVEARQTVRQASMLYVRVCVPIGLVIATLPGAVTSHLFPAGYGDVAAVLPWAAATGVCMGAVNLTTTFFQAEEVYSRTIRVLVAALAIATALDIFGIHTADIHGLAIGATIGGAIAAVLLLRDVQRRWEGATRGLVVAGLACTAACAPLALLRDRPLMWGAWAIIAAAVPALRALRRFGTRQEPPRPRPRVLHLGYEDPARPGAGGGAVRTHEVNRVLARDFDITVVCARYRGSRPRVEEGVRYVHVGVPAGYFGTILAYFVCVPWALLRYRSDLVVEDFGAPFSSIAVPWMTTRPVVGVVQWLFAAQKTAQYHLPFHLAEQVGVSSHRHLVAVSDELGSELRRRNPSAEVTVVENGVDRRAWHTPPQPRAGIRYLGRLERAQKGLDMLLAAYAAMERGVEQDLFLGGDGPDRKVLERHAAELGIAHRVHFVGRIEPDDRFDWLAAADLVVMPSRYETFGMVAAESLAVGTPVVAFDIACLRALVTETVGVAVPSFDVARFAAAVAALANDPARRALLGAAGPASVEGLQWERLAWRQGDVYQRALRAPQQPDDRRVAVTA